MTSTRQRETLSKDILEHVTFNGQRVQLIKPVSSARVQSFTGNVPFWRVALSDLSAPDAHDPGADPLLLAECDGWRLKLSQRTAACPYVTRHIDADRLMFVHQGHLVVFTELGAIEGPAGTFIFIGRGIGHRVASRAQETAALIIESDKPLVLHPSCEAVELPLIMPTPATPASGDDGPEMWEERLITRHWTAQVVRSYDPLRVKKALGKARAVYGIATDVIPAHSPTAPTPGTPFELFTSPTMELQLSKRADPLPFYHRNVERSEIEFCHLGSGDQDTELGYVAAPPGTLYNLPIGIGHSPANRSAPLVNLIWETEGRVDGNPAVVGQG